MRSTNVTRGGIRRVCGAMVVSLAVWLGHSPAAEASITVSLQQVGAPAVAVSGTQTIVFADVVVSGAFVPEQVSGFLTTLSWTGNVYPTDLYPVNPLGQPVLNSDFIAANQPGYLFYNAAFPALTFAQPPSEGASAREIEINWNGNMSSLPTLSTGVTIARLQFAVAEDVDDAIFTFDFSGNSFVGADLEPVPFTSGGGTIAVVPEPGTLQACILGIAVVGGNLLRRQVRRRQQGGQPALV